MGSDSRTATASSKSRPSWRDRHLSQLSDEQLDEVKQHRDHGGEESVGQMAGIDSESSTASTNVARATPPKPPRQQAGPAPEDRSRSNQPYSQNQNRAPEIDDRRYRDSGAEEARYAAQQHRVRESVDHRSRDDLDRHSYRRDPMTREQADPIQARHDQSRPAFSDRNDDRYRYRTDHQTDHTAQYAASPDAVTTEPKKGLVDRVLDFKLPAPVKYGLMALAIAAMVAVSLLKPIDHSSQSQLDSAFTRAMIGFGLARALNGVISVAQGTEFAVQPAGVGVNFSPGEILDPINDLVERFSWVMLLATSSIGIQQILLQVSSWTGISVLLAGAGLFFLLTRLRNSSVARTADFAGKLLLAMLLVRFLIPIGSLANDWVYQQFLQPQYEESAAELEVASERIKEISTRQAEASDDDGSITDRARKLYSSMTSKFDFDGMLDDYKQSAETVSENAINLIVVFVLQTIIFPLLFMYLVYRLFRFALLPSRPPQ